MKTRTKFLIGLGAYFLLTIILLVAFGNAGKNDSFKPQDEFKLDPWISIKIGGIDLSINRFVFYVVLASALTIWVMVWISRRMQEKPNRVQTAVEVAYDLTRNN
ncbi:MAG TPA: F0F1 ATP synthase subunit A, partial [Solirubrobacterales bacterium]